MAPPTSTFTFPTEWAKKTPTLIHNKLLAWFDERQRELPWRTQRDPYAIWLSEVMLQQTTVAAVVPFFQRFLQRFPTVQHLASADEQEVLQYWQGLGYYRRARHLHAAAKILATFGAELPGDAKLWASLPGVGRYILGAIMSQAYEQPFPIVEANSLRVYSRWFASRLDPRKTDGQKWLWAAAEAMLPKKRLGDFNQAVMELGSLVCKSQQPDCAQCPVRAECLANRYSLQPEIPPPIVKKTPELVAQVGVILRNGEQMLLCQRPATAKRWQLMWEFPHAERHTDESTPDAAKRIAQELTGIAIADVQPFHTIRYAVTRFKLILECVIAEVNSVAKLSPFYVASRWVTSAEISEYPLSTAQRKLALRLQ